MKPDLYLQKQSREWKKKHKTPYINKTVHEPIENTTIQNDTIQDAIQNDSIQDAIQDTIQDDTDEKNQESFLQYKLQSNGNVEFQFKQEKAASIDYKFDKLTQKYFELNNITIMNDEQGQRQKSYYFKFDIPMKNDVIEEKNGNDINEWLDDIL